MMDSLSPEEFRKTTRMEKSSGALKKSSVESLGIVTGMGKPVGMRSQVLQVWVR